jgi:hypothetical protein
VSTTAKTWPEYKQRQISGRESAPVHLKGVVSPPYLSEHAAGPETRMSSSPRRTDEMTGEKGEEEGKKKISDSSFISQAVYDCMRPKR